MAQQAWRLELGSLCPHKHWVGMELRKQREGIPGAGWIASLVILVDFGFTLRPCLNE